MFRQRLNASAERNNLRSDNIPIQDKHTHKPFCNALLMQRFVSHIAFRETDQE